MSKSELETIINQAWDKKEEINKNSDKKIIDAINLTISDLDSGLVRVAEKINIYQRFKGACCKCY